MKKVSLRNLIKTQATGIFGKKWSHQQHAEAPFLLKFIDAHDHLSLQVHPTPAYAVRHEKEAGKTESWLILATGKKPDEGYVYLGFHPRIRPNTSEMGLKSQFKKRIDWVSQLGLSLNQNSRRAAARQILPLLNKIKVKPGDVLHVPSGTPHVIGKGVRLFEIQTTSDLTYRVWDWNRFDSEKLKIGRRVARPLHLSKAMDVLKFQPMSPRDYFRSPRILSRWPKDGWRERQLVKEKSGPYALNELRFNSAKVSYEEILNNRFRVITVLHGKIKMASKSSQSDSYNKDLILEPGESALIPANLWGYKIELKSVSARVLKSYLP